MPTRRTEPRPTFSETIDAVVRDSPCDIAVVKQRGVNEVRSILVPVRGGPHASLSMRLARDLSRRFKAELVVMHVAPKGIGERARHRQQQALDRFIAEHGGGRRVRGLLREAASVRTAILREAAHHDLVVMGASAQPSNATPEGRFLFGVVAETVAAKAKPTVIVVKTRQALAAGTFDDLRAAEGSFAAADAFVERSTSLSALVDKWFTENTFHAGEFRDIAKLVELKERQGITISVGLPALNEEKTIGLVIRRIKEPLMDKVPLIDQIHRLMHLWKAGDVIKVDEYLEAKALRRNVLFHQLLQALIELAPAGSEERSLLESISNHVVARGPSSERRQLDLIRVTDTGGAS